MEIPADGLIIQSHDVKIDESQLTGENESVLKDKYDAVIRYKSVETQVKATPQDVLMKKLPSCVVLSGSKVRLI